MKVLDYFKQLLNLLVPRKQLTQAEAKKLYHPRPAPVNRTSSWDLRVFVPWLWADLLMDHIESGPYRIQIANIRRGMGNVDEGRFPEAIDDFTKALAQESAVASFERGRAYWYVGRFQEATDDLLRTAQSNPEDHRWLFHIYYLLGDSYRQIGNHKMAILNLGIAIRKRLDASAYVSRGWAYLA